MLKTLDVSKQKDDSSTTRPSSSSSDEENLRGGWSGSDDESEEESNDEDHPDNASTLSEAVEKSFLRAIQSAARPHQVACITHCIERFQQQKEEAAEDSTKKSTNLLVQHSTGSGKSLTIAALAYHLARLSLFKVVLILTDRRVLDRQIAHGVRHFLHKNGWHDVHSITSCDDLTRQLVAAARRPDGSTVLISTIQKFRGEEDSGKPKTALLQGVRCAVLCDEAHRSYGGVATSNLLEMLGGESHMRGSHASFVGFTATPAESTLQLFGERSRGPTPHLPTETPIPHLTRARTNRDRV